MNKQRIISVVALVAGMVGLAGCDTGETSRREEQYQTSFAPAPSQPTAKKTKIADGIWFEVEGKTRRVYVEAKVCFREQGFLLECLLCKNDTKEHESILVTKTKASQIHTALLAAGAVPGKPVQYKEVKDKIEVIPPTGTRIKVTIEYEKDGKKVRVPAEDWVVDLKSKKKLVHGWVFCGSRFYQDPAVDKVPRYLADEDGGYICVANLPTALMDIPVNSPRDNESLEYGPNSKLIPPVGTKVLVILEPVSDKNPTKK
ncbi:MAG: hypothetical protein KatS3mg105_4281 [Gemmatales bacterium]|nr:MAG: hypothetical protein KatS3mg105_4281 [Gemmatales bacterium]